MIHDNQPSIDPPSRKGSAPYFTRAATHASYSARGMNRSDALLMQ